MAQLSASLGYQLDLTHNQTLFWNDKVNYHKKDE